MKAFELEITCTMDDGATLVATIDQRDYAAFERSDLARQEIVQPATKSRFLAWNALRRTKRTGFTWDEFDLEQCAAAIITKLPDGIGEQDSEDEESENPSQG